LACSSTVQITSSCDLNIPILHQDQIHALLSVTSTISFAFIIMARKERLEIVERKSNIINRLMRVGARVLFFWEDDDVVHRIRFQEEHQRAVVARVTGIAVECGQATRTSCSQGKER